MIDVPVQFPGLIEAMIQVESGCDLAAIGDKGLKNTAYGCLQITQPYMTDALGPNRKAEETLHNKDLSIQAMNAYMTRYATARRLGRPATAQDIARIHNGGPNGWKIDTTLGYWKKILKFYKN